LILPQVIADCQFKEQIINFQTVDPKIQGSQPNPETPAERAAKVVPAPRFAGKHSVAQNEFILTTSKSRA
jgi:hypothetical protein